MGNFPFLARTALRDSRKNRGRLLLFMSSIILGVAALVAINSFNYNLVADIDRQASTLLGADIAITGNREAAATIQASLDSLPAEHARQLELFSMAYLPKTEHSQFSRITALEGNFPFYGKIKTIPEDAYLHFQDGPTALVDEGLMLQQKLSIGDSIRIGQASFVISGRLQAAFGSSGMGSGFAPPVYIPMEYVPATGLVQPGSLVNYAYYLKVDEDMDVDTWAEQREETYRGEGMRIETINGRKEALNEAFSNLNNFLNLVALVALLLGCIGVASSVFIYVKSKISSIAVLRCLGMKGNQAFMIYFIQIISLGLLGVLAGVILGSGIQLLLPRVFSDFLPFEVSTVMSWPAVFEGLIIGVVITFLFALIPLLKVRTISPLRTLRASLEEQTSKFDPLRWGVFGLIGLSIFLFLWRLTGSPLDSFFFLVGFLIAFLILFLVSRLIIWGVKRYFPRKWNFVWRQGLSNLFRPNNQTQTLLVSIGLGTAILTTLFIIQGLMLDNVASMEAGNQPNMILYGIETNQTEELATITERYDMPLIQQVPIVTMRIAGWQGRTKADWLADTSRTARSWAYNREIRVTFRDTLDTEEEVLEGTFPRPYQGNGDSVFISLHENFAEAMDVTLGDEIEFNIQGMVQKTYVGSIRDMEFSSMRTRFLILFPTGVLEEAPQFHVLVTKSPNTETTAAYRDEVVKTFSNISVVDLGSILMALNDILNKVSAVIQFMAAFSILTGLIVLISSLLLSKYQRIQESVLLRTIGASRRQIRAINATEYAFLGILAAATGIVIAIASSWLMARFQLELEFHLSWWPIILVFVFVVGLIIFIGLLNSREVVNKAPLEVLRKEA